MTSYVYSVDTQLPLTTMLRKIAAGLPSTSRSGLDLQTHGFREKEEHRVGCNPPPFMKGIHGPPRLLKIDNS
jgi:hypothetical protein